MVERVLSAPRPFRGEDPQFELGGPCLKARM